MAERYDELHMTKLQRPQLCFLTKTSAVVSSLLQALVDARHRTHWGKTVVRIVMLVHNEVNCEYLNHPTLLPIQQFMHSGLAAGSGRCSQCRADAGGLAEGPNTPSLHTEAAALHPRHPEVDRRA